MEGPGLLPELGPALDDLHREVAAPIVARRPWLETWVASYRDHHPWAVVVEGAGGRLEAAALLATRRRRGIAEVVRMGQGASDYGRLPARSPEAAAALADAVAERMQRLRGPWHLYVGQLPEGDLTARELASRLRGVLLPCGGAPRLQFGSERSLRAYLSANHRRHSRKAANRLRRAGRALSVDHFDRPEEIDALLPEVDDVRRQRDEDAGRPNKLRDPRYAAFRRAVILELAERNEIDLTTLRIDGNLAAYNVNLLDGGSCRMWDGRFRPAWSWFSPGHLVVDASLQWALDDPRFTEVDMIRGTLQYKLSFANDVVRCEALEAWSSPVPRLLFDVTDRVRDVRRRIRPGYRQRAG